MMHTMQKMLCMMFVVFSLGGLVACEQEGPMERTGENIDDAATDMGNAVEDKCEEAKEGMGAADTDC